jgi:tetratricopeptide (TPR) repeat protein
VRTVVLDTNVLLARPEALMEFPGAEVLIPDTVLSEIDKLKTARVDSELRYKGREVSRLLFELSELGPLHEGVDVPGGGRLRVVSLDQDAELPEGLSARNADDRILAIALQAKSEGRHDLTLVTSDLNMLLKAQSHGIDIDRVEIDDSFTRRYLIRPFQRYRIQIGILAVAVAVFAAVLVLTMSFSGGSGPAGLAAIPTEFVDQLTVEQQQVLNYLYRLQANPKDTESQKSLAILYDQMSSQNLSYVPYAIKHWEAVLQASPDDADARTDLATLYFRSGKLDSAMTEVSRVLRQDPNHVNANFNIGIFYLNSKPPEYQKAANQFLKVISLTQGRSDRIDALRRAQTSLDETKKNAAAAGVTIKTDGGTTL